MPYRSIFSFASFFSSDIGFFFPTFTAFLPAADPIPTSWSSNLNDTTFDLHCSNEKIAGKWTDTQYGRERSMHRRLAYGNTGTAMSTKSTLKESTSTQRRTSFCKACVKEEVSNWSPLWTTIRATAFLTLWNTNRNLWKIQRIQSRCRK